MVCRAPNPAVGSCAGGTNTGQQLSYDAEGRLLGWQNVPGPSPASTASFRYDGEGARVAQQSTSSGTTTTTRYLLGGLEELTTSGATTTLTKYYSVPGVVTAIKVGTTLSYLATDGLGSVSVALAAAGSTTGQALYLPYGAGRYSSGSMPTARGYTGQYQDSTSGLDYYGARYYDPALSQFTSADTVLDGLNRYGYVHDNPTTATDPTGEWSWPQVWYGVRLVLELIKLAAKTVLQWPPDWVPPSGLPATPPAITSPDTRAPNNWWDALKKILLPDQSSDNGPPDNDTPPTPVKPPSGTGNNPGNNYGQEPKNRVPKDPSQVKDNHPKKPHSPKLVVTPVPVAVYRWADIRFGVPSSQPTGGTTPAPGTPSSHNTQPDFSQWHSYPLGAQRFAIAVLTGLLLGAAFVAVATGGPPGGVTRWGSISGSGSGGGQGGRCQLECRV